MTDHGIAAWEWAVLGAMFTVIVSLVGALWGVVRAQARADREAAALSVEKLEAKLAIDLEDVRRRGHANGNELQKYGERIAVLEEHKSTTKEDLGEIREEFRTGLGRITQTMGELAASVNKLLGRLGSTAGMQRVDPRVDPR